MPNTTYINVPITTDPDDLADIAFAYLQARYPNWVPHDGQLDTWLISAIGRQAAELREVASDVPAAIFRYFGASLLGVPPLDAVAATFVGTVNAINANGYTFPALSLVVGIRDANGMLQGFTNNSDVTVTLGTQSLSNVTFTAVEPGAAATGLGVINAQAEIVSAQLGVSSVSISTVSSGGQDEEANDDYLDRLAADLSLQAPRPILPNDFAVYARNITGVGRALALDTFDNTQYSSVSQPASTTANSATVTGLPANYTNITKGALCLGRTIKPNTYVASINPANGSLTMTNTAIDVMNGENFTVVNGYGYARAVTVAVADASGNPVAAAIKAAAQTYLSAAREINFLVYVIDPTYTSIDVIWDVNAWPGFSAATVTASIVNSLQTFFSPAKWGNPPYGDQNTWNPNPVVKIDDVIAAVKVPEVRNVNSVFMRPSSNASYSSTDIVLAGAAPLPRTGLLGVGSTVR